MLCDLVREELYSSSTGYQPTSQQLSHKMARRLIDDGAKI